MGEKEATEHVNKIMKFVDLNNNNEISYSEFVLASINREKFLTRDRLRQAFNTFDRNLSGTIDTDEILEIFSNSNFT